jgi:hypothetical protein
MGDAGTVTMSAKELNRLEVLSRVRERRLTQRAAAEQLGLLPSPGRALVPGSARSGSGGPRLT